MKTNKIIDSLQWKPINQTTNEEYEKKWFCNENKIIHGNFTEYIKCKDCISEKDKQEYEEIMRKRYIEWFYLNENTPIELIKQSYNVKIINFN